MSGLTIFLCFYIVLQLQKMSYVPIYDSFNMSGLKDFPLFLYSRTVTVNVFKFLHRIIVVCSTLLGKILN